MSDPRTPGSGGDAGAALPPGQARAREPAAAVASPCINVCEMHAATGWCVGCLRTLDEIAGWGRWSDAQKRAVWLQLDGRRERWRQLQAAGDAPAAPVPQRGSSLPR